MELAWQCKQRAEINKHRGSLTSLSCSCLILDINVWNVHNKPLKNEGKSEGNNERLNLTSSCTETRNKPQRLIAFCRGISHLYNSIRYRFWWVFSVCSHILCYSGKLQCSLFPLKLSDPFFKELESYTCLAHWKSESLKQSTWGVRLGLKSCTRAPRHSVVFLLPGALQQSPLCVRHFIVRM